ncbi:MAG: phosphatase PAP2 family protein [Deltaproteobacteria bacterium]|jgi:membrane-associated phospholipid phosphatase|nr:phosphatase PAP2 family protein [Deltaproteobacteria bacterium]
MSSLFLAAKKAMSMFTLGRWKIFPVLLAICLALALAPSRLSAETFYGDDYLIFLIPAYAAGYSYYKERQFDGILRLGLSLGTAELASEGLKRVTNKKRPNWKPGDAKRSFPSGHAVAAFSGAMFLHARYSFKEAAIPYVFAAWTAYGRVARDKHHVEDVLGSVAVSGIFTFIFVRPYEPSTDDLEMPANLIEDKRRFNVVPQFYYDRGDVAATFGFNF